MGSQVVSLGILGLDPIHSPWKLLGEKHEGHPRWLLEKTLYVETHPHFLEGRDPGIPTL
jgi:hypothetical protein